jgi:hypothetical protein
LSLSADPRPTVSLGRIEGVHGEGGGAEVVVEQAGQRGAVFGARALVMGNPRGVGANRIVKLVTARRLLLEKAFVEEQIEHVMCGGEFEVAERCRGVWVEIAPGVEGQKPKQPPPGCREALKRGGQGRTDDLVPRKGLESLDMIGKRPISPSDIAHRHGEVER